MVVLTFLAAGVHIFNTAFKLHGGGGLEPVGGNDCTSRLRLKAISAPPIAAEIGVKLVNIRSQRTESVRQIDCSELLAGPLSGHDRLTVKAGGSWRDGE